MNTELLVNKWSHKIAHNWYGFDIAGVPDDWVIQIDEFLTWLEEVYPQFQIRQIKVKFGGLRIYLDLSRDGMTSFLYKEIDAKINKLEELYSKDLVY